MRRLLFAPLALAVALAALPAVAPVPAAGAPAAQAEVLALVFAADWCGACKVIDLRLQALKPALADAPVAFVTLDQTDRAARAASARTAETGGYADLYREHKGKTGFVLLVDAETTALLGRLTAADSEAQMRRKVRAALARA